MITVASNKHQERLAIMEEEIILNGPPSDLQGSIQFINRESDPLRIKNLALAEDGKRELQASAQSKLNFAFRLNPGERKRESVSHQLPPNTPPGIYEHYIMLGNTKHKVKMIVQPTIEVDLFPSEFTFQGTSPGTTHVAIVTLTNSGNLPFQVPDLKHAASLDMDLLCRAFGKGFRERGDDDLRSTLDEVTKNIKDNLTDWVDISVDECGQIVQPGESVLLHINFTMPKNASPKRDYDGNFRFWDQEISINVKSHRENTNNENYEKQSK